MKHIDEMTGIERAASLLVALGPERAADILKHLDEKTVEALSLEIMKIGHLSPEAKDDLLGEFILALRKTDSTLNAGKESAREILDKAFGTEKTSQILKKVAAADFEKEFDFFNDADAGVLMLLLRKESPQMMAVILTYMPPLKAAEILKKLPKDTAKDVALRMARLDSIAPEAVFDLVKRLKENYKKYEENLKKGFGGDGLDLLVQIMSYMSSDEEQRFIKNLDDVVPNISKNIKERVISFESVLSISNNDIRILIEKINNDSLIAMALKGADDDTRFAFLRNMSQNRANDMLDEMEMMGAVRKTEVYSARNEIAKVMGLLYESGIIHIKRPGEIYVE